MLAIDIHAKSAEIARRNAALNGVAERVEAVESDGYRHPAIAAPYDLILANILAKPLIAFAPDRAAT